MRKLFAQIRAWWDNLLLPTDWFFDYLVTPCARFLILIMPAPNPKWQILYIIGYADVYNASKMFVIGWHKKRLAELDPDYARHQGELSLVAARHRADKQGISPLDPRYPKLEDHDPTFRKFLGNG